MAKSEIYDRAELKPWHCGRTKRNKALCQGRRVEGTGVHGPCRMHGGSAPQVKAKVSREAAEAEIRQALKDRKLSSAAPVTDPFDELQRLAGEVVLWKDKLGALVDELSDERYVVDTVFGEAVNAKLKLFRAAIQDCAAVLGMMAKLNIDERRVRLDEMAAQLVLKAIDVGLAAAGVSGPAALAGKQAAAKVLRTDVSLVA